jgi:hypothetical protein
MRDDVFALVPKRACVCVRVHQTSIIYMHNACLCVNKYTTQSHVSVCVGLRERFDTLLAELEFNMHYLSALLFSRALLSEMFKKLLCAPKKGHRNHQPVRTNDVRTLHVARREFFLSIRCSRTFEILGVFSCTEYCIGRVI